MFMDANEICTRYRDAKDRRKQIGILADLNLCDKQDIINLLMDRGYDVSTPKRKSPSERQGNSPIVWTEQKTRALIDLYTRGAPRKEIMESTGASSIQITHKLQRLKRKFPSLFMKG